MNIDSSHYLNFNKIILVQFILIIYYWVFPFIGTGYSSSKELKESGIDSPSDRMSSSTEETIENSAARLKLEEERNVSTQVGLYKWVKLSAGF